MILHVKHGPDWNGPMSGFHLAISFTLNLSKLDVGHTNISPQPSSVRLNIEVLIRGSY